MEAEKLPLSKEVTNQSPRQLHDSSNTYLSFKNRWTKKTQCVCVCMHMHIHTQRTKTYHEESSVVGTIQLASWCMLSHKT